MYRLTHEVSDTLSRDRSIVSPSTRDDDFFQKRGSLAVSFLCQWIAHLYGAERHDEHDDQSHG